MSNFISNRFSRQWKHDIEQAQRRTDAQNKVIIDLITKTDVNGKWAYIDVPIEGGTVELMYGDKRWSINKEGNVEELCNE